MITHLLFLMFVGIAVYAQSVTGFALSFILLGLIGTINLVPIVDAVNIVSVILVINSITFLYKRWPMRFEKILWPALVTSLIWTALGMLLLVWLAGVKYEIARLLLGISIVVCALLLWQKTKPLAKESSSWTFALFGSFSGLLGGLFSAPGPPFVYLMYRQPWASSRILESLIFFFGIITFFRLAVAVSVGQFSINALVLTLEALPVAYLVTTITASKHPPLSPSKLKALVCCLLIAVGAAMAITATMALTR